MNDSPLSAAFGIELLHIFSNKTHLIIPNFVNYFNGIQTQNNFFFPLNKLRDAHNRKKNDRQE